MWVASRVVAESREVALSELCRGDSFKGSLKLEIFTTQLYFVVVAKMPG